MDNPLQARHRIYYSHIRSYFKMDMAIKTAFIYDSPVTQTIKKYTYSEVKLK
jgi:hypothetical protein